VREDVCASATGATAKKHAPRTENLRLHRISFTISSNSGRVIWDRKVRVAVRTSELTRRQQSE